MREKLGKASEVRELLDLSSNARVYELARRRILPGVVYVGRQVRFDITKISKFIEEGGLAVPVSKQGPQQPFEPDPDVLMSHSPIRRPEKGQL